MILYFNYDFLINFIIRVISISQKNSITIKFIKKKTIHQNYTKKVPFLGIHGHTRNCITTGDRRPAPARLRPPTGGPGGAAPVGGRSPRARDPNYLIFLS